jgi:hypothetical protein
MMAVNDDIYTAENILSKQLGVRHPDRVRREKSVRGSGRWSQVDAR